MNSTPRFNSVGPEADRLETIIGEAHLTIDQEIAVWDYWRDHGLAGASHVVTAMKEARNPALLRIKQKDAPAPGSAEDLLQQLIARVGRAKVEESLQAALGAGMSSGKGNISDNESMTTKAKRGGFARLFDEGVKAL